MNDIPTNAVGDKSDPLDDIDTRLRAHADSWNSGFTTPAMPVLAGTTGNARHWAKPVAVAASFLVAAAAVVAITVNLPAREHATPGPADSSHPSTTVEPIITREIPQTYEYNGLTLPFLETTAWQVAIQNEENAARIRFGEFENHTDSACAPVSVPVVVRETATSVTIANTRYFDSTHTACAADVIMQDPIWAELAEPLGDRKVLDASGPGERTVWRQSDLPEPSYLPDGLARLGGITVSAKGNAANEAWRKFDGGRWLQVTVTRADNPGSAGTSFATHMSVQSRRNSTQAPRFSLYPLHPTRCAAIPLSAMGTACWTYRNCLP